MLKFTTIACTLTIAIAGLSSCKKEEKPAAAPGETAEVKDTEASAVPATSPPVAAEEHLVLAESKIVISVPDSDVSKSLLIGADGKITAAGKEVASLSKIGEMNVAGEVVATLAKDGTLTFKQSGKTMTISDAGEVTDEGKVMMLWKEDGTLGGEAVKAMQGMGATFEGPPEQRKAATYAFLIGMMSTSSSSVETATTDEAAPEAPAEAAPEAAAEVP